VIVTGRPDTHLLSWVREVAELTTPDRTVWGDAGEGVIVDGGAKVARLRFLHRSRRSDPAIHPMASTPTTPRSRPQAQTSDSNDVMIGACGLIRAESRDVDRCGVA
jgi:hypothetical protein